MAPTLPLDDFDRFNRHVEGLEMHIEPPLAPYRLELEGLESIPGRAQFSAHTQLASAFRVRYEQSNRSSPACSVLKRRLGFEGAILAVTTEPL